MNRNYEVEIIVKDDQGRKVSKTIMDPWNEKMDTPEKVLDAVIEAYYMYEGSI